MAIDQELRSLFLAGLKELKGIVVASDNFWEGFGASMLNPAWSMIKGGPGTGKTVLMRSSAIVFFGKGVEPEGMRGLFTIINSYEGMRAEDTIYDVDIEQHRKTEQKKSMVFRVRPRAFMKARMCLLNEFNRTSADLQSSILPIMSEGFIEIRGTRLTKQLGKVWVDFNPYYGGFDPAFVDRFVSSLTMEELGVVDQVGLMRRKYADRHVEDLVSTAKPVMTAEQMEKVWEDVRGVEFQKKDMAIAVLSLKLFSACKYKLGSVNSVFFEGIDHDKCEFKESCLTKLLNRPVLTRSSDSLVQMAKAFAYLDGRDKVDLNIDLLPALRLSVLHRLDLVSMEKKTFPHEDKWFEERVEKSIEERNKQWVGINKTLMSIKQLIKDGNQDDAVVAYSKALGEVKDITCNAMLRDSLGEKIEEIVSEQAALMLTKLQAMDKWEVSFKKKHVETMKAKKGALPPDHALVQKITDMIARIEFRLAGRFTMPSEKFRRFVRDLHAAWEDGTPYAGSLEGPVDFDFNDGKSDQAEPALHFSAHNNGTNADVTFKVTESELAQIIDKYRS